VHGDIRAFNTVFGEQADQGWLIDFDFGGSVGIEHPPGYNWTLADGYRVGNAIAKEGDNEILKWHDWYALGRLIFDVHKLKPPVGNNPWELGWYSLPFVLPFKHLRRSLLRSRHSLLKDEWEERQRDPTAEITQLKDFLRCVDKEGWTVNPNQRLRL
jgi:hypothetical protein